jgi:hypothetical protein
MSLIKTEKKWISLFLSNSHPRTKLGVDFIFVKKEEQQEPSPKLSKTGL